MPHSSNILQGNQVIFYLQNVLNLDMVKMHIKQLLARNLQAAMDAKYGDGNFQSQLSRDTKRIDNYVAPKTICNYLAANKLNDPNDPELEKIPSASLVHMDALAQVLNIGVWELVHPDPKRVQREHEMYAKIERDFSALTGRQRTAVEDNLISEPIRHKQKRKA